IGRRCEGCRAGEAGVDRVSPVPQQGAQARGGSDIVIDDEYLPRSVRNSSGTRRSGEQRGRGLRDQGQTDAELASLAGTGAVRSYITAMEPGQLAGEGQAQAEARPRLRRPRILLFFFF